MFHEALEDETQSETIEVNEETATAPAAEEEKAKDGEEATEEVK